MDNSFKISTLLVLSFCLVTNFVTTNNAKATSVEDSFEYYIKITDELAWPSKARFEIAKAPLITIENGQKRPSTISAPGLAFGYIIPQDKSLSVEIAYKRYQLKYSQSDTLTVESAAKQIEENKLFSKNDVFEVAGTYTFLENDLFNPYVRLGIGLASKVNRMEHYEYDSNYQLLNAGFVPRYPDNNFAFSGGVGAETNVLHNLKIALAYSYQNMGPMKLDGRMSLPTDISKSGIHLSEKSSFGSSKTNSIQLSLKYLF